MSIICAAIKKGIVAISCDTQSSFGSTKVSAEHIENSNKLYTVNGSVIGLVGWHAISNMVEHLILHNKKSFKLKNRMEIFSTLTLLHEKLKEEYYIETKEEEDQPVESSQLDGIIINKNGIFEIGSYREVNEFKTFWGVGSGQEIAIGAMHALYKTKATAKQIVEAGVKAAAEYNSNCALPLITKTMRLKK